MIDISAQLHKGKVALKMGWVLSLGQITLTEIPER
jgi:hypothetical protein